MCIPLLNLSSGIHDLHPWFLLPRHVHIDWLNILQSVEIVKRIRPWSVTLYAATMFSHDSPHSSTKNHSARWIRTAPSAVPSSPLLSDTRS